MRKVIAITGASAGIGRATAVRLARTGAAIVFCARRRHRLDEVAAEIADAGGEGVPVTADVTSEADMQGLVAGAVDRFGRLDAMVCNAGFAIYGRMEDVTAAKAGRLMDVNYMGTYHAARAALPIFRRQASGHVIMVSSIVGKRGVPYMGAYAATKFAQAGLAECLRAELVGSGIHVSVVFPISTHTEFFDVMKRESGHATRAGGPSQTADVVAEAIARTIERPVAEVYPYPVSRGLALLNAIAPGFCDRVVQRWRREPIEP